MSRSRTAASLSVRWRSASVESRSPGPGPPSTAPEDDSTTVRFPTEITVGSGSTARWPSSIRSVSRIVSSARASASVSGGRKPRGEESAGLVLRSTPSSSEPERRRAER